MAKKIMRLKWFDITMEKQEGEYLTEMRKKGWKLTKIILPCFYIFEECTPEDIVYQLDFSQEHIEDREEYLLMYADCGWEHVYDYMGYSYFTKPVAEMNGEESIFNDDESRDAMKKLVFRKRLVPICVIYVLIVLPRFVMGIIERGESGKGLMIIWSVFMVLYTIIIIKCCVSYSRFRKDANMG